jgi:hypothetical protein
VIKQTLIVFLFSVFSALSMEIDDSQIPSQSLSRVESKKIDIVTDASKRDSYSIAINLCVTEADRGQFSEKIQRIYDAHNLNLTYKDEGKFWQTPHVTLVIFEKVKLQNIEQFQGIFPLLNTISVQFTPTTCEFFGKGDWLVTKPNPSTAKKIKQLNARVIDWVHENISPETYKIQNNTTKNKITPHISLNTTISTKQLDEKYHIKNILSKSLKSAPIDLEDVIITATNEWS